MTEVIMPLLAASILVAFVWFVWATDRMEAEEHERLMEEIKQYPPNVQIVLYRAYCREQADKDRL